MADRQTGGLWESRELEQVCQSRIERWLRWLLSPQEDLAAFLPYKTKSKPSLRDGVSKGIDNL